MTTISYSGFVTKDSAHSNAVVRNRLTTSQLSSNELHADRIKTNSLWIGTTQVNVQSFNGILQSTQYTPTIIAQHGFQTLTPVHGMYTQNGNIIDCQFSFNGTVESTPLTQLTLQLQLPFTTNPQSIGSIGLTNIQYATTVGSVNHCAISDVETLDLSFVTDAPINSIQVKFSCRVRYEKN